MEGDMGRYIVIKFRKHSKCELFSPRAQPDAMLILGVKEVLVPLPLHSVPCWLFWAS